MTNGDIFLPQGIKLEIAENHPLNNWEFWVVQNILSGKKALLLRDFRAFLTAEKVIYRIDETAVQQTWQEFESNHRLHNDPERYDGIIEAKRLIDLQF